MKRVFMATPRANGDGSQHLKTKAACYFLINFFLITLPSEYSMRRVTGIRQRGRRDRGKPHHRVL
jgi:hypothetical protein